MRRHCLSLVGGLAGVVAIPSIRAQKKVEWATKPPNCPINRDRAQRDDSGLARYPLAEENAEVLHWHGDTFDLPGDAVRLVSTAAYENQAFAFGKSNLGLQFHLEVDARRLEEWYVGHAVELAAAQVSIESLRKKAAAVEERLPSQAERIFKGWLRQLSFGKE